MTALGHAFLDKVGLPFMPTGLIDMTYPIDEADFTPVGLVMESMYLDRARHTTALLRTDAILRFLERVNR